ncbi:putative mediator of RNA polymerase II transcription subunit 12 [Entelurus aequoreus]|uniref:putative mediator of RNA polymerase II transcription subunit 12 n=1 Tax=Entelurus aequoreus TaxID=161455 RepID=UPI002B1E8D9C|nr:putative mediator of RNA polymerase II transcription subunit 12 [Entelurus aequoreus]
MQTHKSERTLSGSHVDDARHATFRRINGGGGRPRQSEPVVRLGRTEVAKMSADDFQSKYASFMEHIVKSTVEETTKLFETMVDDLKAELSRAKMENEALKTTCRENETLNTPSVNESSQSEGPERRDTAVQCDLLPSHASLGQSTEDQNPQRAHEERVYNLLKDHDYDASFKDIFYQSQPEMLNVSRPTDTSNELFLALSDSSPDSSGETDSEDYQIDQQTDTEDHQTDQQTVTEDIDRQCSYGMCRKNKCLVTAVQAGLKRDGDVHKPPTKSARSPATTGNNTKAKSNQTLGRKGYANPSTFQEQLAAPKVKIQHQSFGKTPANKQARVVVQQYSGVSHSEEQQVEPRLPEKQMQGKEQQVEPRLPEKQMQGKEQQVEPRLPEKQMQGKEQQVEARLLEKQMQGKEQQVEPRLPEKQMQGKEQQVEPRLPEKQMQEKEQQVESTLLKKQMEQKEQQIESTLLKKQMERKEQQKEPTLWEKQIERKEQQVQSTLLGKQPEGKEQRIELTVIEKELEGKEQRIKQTLPEKELEQTEQQVESTPLEKQMERKEQQVESTLLEKQLDVGGNKCSLTEEEQQVEQTLPEKELAGKEHQVEPTVLEKELVGKEQQIKQTLPEKELEGTELQVEQTLLEKPLKEGPNKYGSTEEKANVEINVTVNKNRRQRKQPSDKVKRLLQTPKQIGVSASNNGEEHNGVEHVPTIFERYTSLCEVTKVSPRSCTTESTTKASPAKSSFPPEIISVQGNASSKKTRANRPHQDRSAHKKTDSPRKSLIRKSGRSKKFYGITKVCLRSSTAKDATTTTNSPLKTTDPPGRKKRVSTRENSALKKTQTISPLQDRSENADTESSGKRSTRNSANSNKSPGVPEVSLRSSTTKDSATTSPLKTKFSPEIISTQENASSKKIQTVSPHQDGSFRKNTESSDNGLGQDGASSEKSLCVPEVCLRSSTTKDTTSTPKSTVPPESISAEEDAGSQLTQTISPHQDLSAHKKTKLIKNSATSKKSHGVPEVCLKLSTTKDTTKTSPAKTAPPPVSMSAKENASLKKTQTNSPQQDRSSHKEVESLGTRLSTFSASSKSHGVPEVGLILSTTKETTATSPQRVHSHLRLSPLKKPLAPKRPNQIPHSRKDLPIKRLTLQWQD